MNGIKMSDCKFYVNEEERIVICVIPKTKYILSDFIEDNFQYNDINFDYGISTVFMSELAMPSSFTGKAVCSPEDKWDEELGRLIAFSRAKDKCYKSFFKRANKLVQTIDRRLNNIMDSFNDFGVKLEDKREKLNTMIDSKFE